MFRRKIALEIEEGVDAIAIKPASHYLDIVRFANDTYDVPVGAFQVSGEYVMLKAFAQTCPVGDLGMALESLKCIKRAGASIIMTYCAMDIARWLSTIGEVQLT